MDTVDSNLEGFEPMQINEREVKQTQKKQTGGPVLAQSGAQLTRKQSREIGQANMGASRQD